jgi:hypothetical protein
MRRKTDAFLLTLLLLLCVPAAAAADDGMKMTAEEIIQKHFEAVGGRQALAKVKSRVAVGTVKKEAEPEAQMAIMSESPDRVAAVFVFRDYDWHMIYDAGKATLRPQMPRQVAPIEDKYREMLASGLMFNGIALYNLLSAEKAEGVRMEAKGTKKVKGRPAHVVELRRGKGDPVRLYFDAETFMWVRTDFGRAEVARQMRAFTNDVVNRSADENAIDFYVETADFRDVDGLKLPFRLEMVVTAPILREKSSGTIVGNIREYRHNVAIDPSMFK